VGVSILTFQSPPGSGGDSFDLADVGLTWARYVRIEAAPFVTTIPGPTNAAFDIDTVAAVHSAISPPAVPGLGALAAGILSTLLLGSGVARAGKGS
jgi:hypothetical protein